jgi:hypothetical protein
VKPRNVTQYSHTGRVDTVRAVRARRPHRLSGGVGAKKPTALKGMAPAGTPAEAGRAAPQQAKISLKTKR